MIEYQNLVGQTPPTEIEFIRPLAQNGPWALVAGFLLWTVIKAWNGDRQLTFGLLGDFQKAIEGLVTAVQNLVVVVEKVHLVVEKVNERLDEIDKKN